MKLIVDKNRLLELTDDPEIGLKAYKLLAYIFPEDEIVYNAVIENLHRDIKEGETFAFEIIVGKHWLQNFNPSISSIPTLLDILREAKRINLEDRYYYTGLFSVILLCLKLNFKELNENRDLFGDDEIGSHIWEYISWIEENRNGNHGELKEELVSVAKALMKEMLKEKEENSEDERLEELQDQIMDFKNLMISMRSEYSDLVYSSLKELDKTEDYILQDLSVEMAGIWRDKESVALLVEIARLADPELSIYQNSIKSLLLIQSEEILPLSEEVFQFQEDVRVSFTEVLGHYPYEKSEEILLRYLHKERDKDIATLCASGLSNIFSQKAIKPITELAEKGKLNLGMISLNEILLPIYLYHKLEIPEWMREEDNFN